MEHVLQKMARQLDALDEASLMNLWEQYAERVARFEPTKRWEEAVLIFSFIQAKRWKNQLFNQHYAEECRPNESTPSVEMSMPEFALEKQQAPAPQQRAVILPFVASEKVVAENQKTSVNATKMPFESASKMQIEE